MIDASHFFFPFDPNFLERFKELWKSYKLTENIMLMLIIEDDYVFNVDINNYTFEIKNTDHKLERYARGTIVDNNDHIKNGYDLFENYIFHKIISSHIVNDIQPIGKIHTFIVKDLHRIIDYDPNKDVYVIHFNYYANIVKDTRWSILKIVLVSFYKQDGNFSIIPMELIQYIFSFLGIVYIKDKIQ
jgi:hypothetical protein